MKAGGCVQVGPNPQPRADFPGGGVRFGHDSAAEGLQDARGPPGPLREPPELAGCQDTRQGGGAAAGPCGASNPSALTDLTGGADAGRYGAHLGTSGARSWGRQSREDARAPAGRRRCCWPPGRTVAPLGPSELGAVLASIANGCPFAKYPGPLPGCCFLFLVFAVRQKYAHFVTLIRGAIHGEIKKRLEPLQTLDLFFCFRWQKVTLR